TIDGQRIVEIAKAILDSQDYSAIYDAKAGLLTGGIDRDGRVETWHPAGTFGSESRLGSQVIAAIGKIPQNSINNSAIKIIKYKLSTGQEIPVLATWDGGAFQMFMPNLFVSEDSNPAINMLLKNYIRVMGDQKKNGIAAAHSASETTSGYNGQQGITALAQNSEALPSSPKYAEYQANITPHALFLAGMVDANFASENLNKLREAYPDIYVPGFGYVDSVNLSTSSTAQYKLTLDDGMIICSLYKMLYPDGRGLSKYLYDSDAGQKLKEILAVQDAKLKKTVEEAGFKVGEPLKAPEQGPIKIAPPVEQQPTGAPVTVPTGWQPQSILKGETAPIGDAAFGNRINPVSGEEDYHTGIDLGGRYGYTEGAQVPAIADGRVVEATNPSAEALGRVVVEHNNGMRTVYMHVTPIVKVGDEVYGGIKIAQVAPKDSHSTAPHLHIETRDKDGTAVDPLGEKGLQALVGQQAIKVEEKTVAKEVPPEKLDFGKGIEELLANLPQARLSEIRLRQSEAQYKMAKALSKLQMDLYIRIDPDADRITIIDPKRGETASGERLQKAIQQDSATRAAAAPSEKAELSDAIQDTIGEKIGSSPIKQQLQDSKSCPYVVSETLRLVASVLANDTINKGLTKIKMSDSKKFNKAIISLTALAADTVIEHAVSNAIKDPNNRPLSESLKMSMADWISSNFTDVVITGIGEKTNLRGMAGEIVDESLALYVRSLSYRAMGFDNKDLEALRLNRMPQRAIASVLSRGLMKKIISGYTESGDLAQYMMANIGTLVAENELLKRLGEKNPDTLKQIINQAVVSTMNAYINQIASERRPQAAKEETTSLEVMILIGNGIKDNTINGQKLLNLIESLEKGGVDPNKIGALLKGVTTDPKTAAALEGQLRKSIKNKGPELRTLKGFIKSVITPLTQSVTSQLPPQAPVEGAGHIGVLATIISTAGIGATTSTLPTDSTINKLVAAGLDIGTATALAQNSGYLDSWVASGALVKNSDGTYSKGPNYASINSLVDKLKLAGLDIGTATALAQNSGYLDSWVASGALVKNPDGTYSKGPNYTSINNIVDILKAAGLDEGQANALAMNSAYLKDWIDSGILAVNPNGIYSLTDLGKSILPKTKYTESTINASGLGPGVASGVANSLHMNTDSMEFWERKGWATVDTEGNITITAAGNKEIARVQSIKPEVEDLLIKGGIAGDISQLPSGLAEGMGHFIEKDENGELWTLLTEKDGTVTGRIPTALLISGMVPVLSDPGFIRLYKLDPNASIASYLTDPNISGIAVTFAVNRGTIEARLKGHSIFEFFAQAARIKFGEVKFRDRTLEEWYGRTLDPKDEIDMGIISYHSERLVLGAPLFPDIPETTAGIRMKYEAGSDIQQAVKGASADLQKERDTKEFNAYEFI
ncbi:MAG: M23 family metallopeptidase, partial [Candidatus Omnitrophota bacterium]|nr:M23 family metallopeptidase [Candidatus Omnitrophota bacterium]